MRVAKRVGVALIAALLLVIVAVHISAEVFRWRAERLLSRVKTLRVEVTPYSAVSALRKDYFSNVVKKEECTEQRCEFSINLTQWESLIRLTWKHPWTERPRFYTVLLLRHFGLRPTDFGVGLRVEGGILRAVSIGLAPCLLLNTRNTRHVGFLFQLLCYGTQ